MLSIMETVAMPKIMMKMVPTTIAATLEPDTSHPSP
jgi:hypothetical protein